MSLSRSPSPIPGGGWSSPGLTLASGRSSPTTRGGFPAASSTPVMWESSRLKNAATSSAGSTSGAAGYPSFATKSGGGFFGRHMRRFSSGLPRFSTGRRDYADKEKLGRGRWSTSKGSGRGGVALLVARIQGVMARMGRKTKMRLGVLLLILLGVILFYNTPLVYHWRRSLWFGGGQKFVIILGANIGGGVMDWKGAREWAIERDSLRNKKKYVARWGYDLEIVDMSTKKRYAHEWRESWEKVDFVRTTLRKYPKAEWVWWVDLNTFIMEPSYSLQEHIFNHLERHVYRDINEYNPLNITHPLTDAYLDAESRSPVGDGQPGSVNLILSQDCSGFNMGSFFLRRGEWTDRLLDVWWDPVAYEQKHMEWAHKEQDALEQLYTAQPWIRKHTAFLPQRMINSFPSGACAPKKEGEEDEDGKETAAAAATATELDPRFHYREEDRDFLVNMAGCEWGRDCWGEMYHFRELSYYLNRSWWERFKEDLLAVIWFKLTGQRVKF